MSSPIESSELTCSPNITDYKISTCLMFTGAFIYILVAGFPALHKVEAHEAKAIQLSADLIFAIFSLISTFGLLHLSFFNGWKYIFADFMVTSKYDTLSYAYCSRAILTTCIWLLWLPNILPFIYCCWALQQWYASGFPSSAYNYDDCLVDFIIGMAIFLWVSFIWVYSTFACNINKNNGFGSTNLFFYLTFFGLIYIHWFKSVDLVTPTIFCKGHESYSETDDSTDTIFKSRLASTTLANEDGQELHHNCLDHDYECGFTTSDFNGYHSRSADDLLPNDSTYVTHIRSNNQSSPLECKKRIYYCAQYIQISTLGSDFTVGAMIYMLSAGVGLALSAYDVVDIPTPQAYQGLVSTLIYFIGTLIFWRASYPHRMCQNNWEGSTVVRDTFMYVCGCGTSDSQNPNFTSLKPDSTNSNTD